MAGLNDMMADILKKAIPPEVAAMMTEENIKAIGEKANGFIAELRGRLEAIEHDQKVILDKLEGLANAAGSDSKRGSRAKRAASGNSGSAS